uniref:J domain-containing protein n=1 Tax=Arcella intermedia TaxID=1963864 RepID=A0A6B2L851_9EUKA
MMLVGVFLCGLVGSVFGDTEYYDILGLPRTARPSDIKQAYRKLAFANHPDKHPNDEEKKKVYQRVTEAYEVLSDEEKRRIYDQYGKEGLKNNGVRQQSFDMNDIFSSFFGGGGGGGRKNQIPKGNPVTIKLQVTLEDLYIGKEVEVLQRRQVLCPHCRGTGAETPDDIGKCSTCGGTGTKTTTQTIGPGFVQRTQSPCDVCAGTGKIIKKKCSHCGGTKTDVAEQMLSVFIEKGMPDGHEIVMSSDGDERPGEEPGDIIFKLTTAPHKRLERRNNDLLLNITISLLESLVGFTRSYIHLDGHAVPFSRDAVTKPGFQMVIKGEGMPHYGFPTQKGDLIITFTIQFPNSLTEEQKVGFQNLLSKT